MAGDVLVFAGDTGYLRDRTLPNLKFWKWASANYREVLLIPGNHEFYGNGDVLAYGDSWSREILPNLILCKDLHNTAYVKPYIM